MQGKYAACCQQNQNHPEYSETLTNGTVYYLPSNVQYINVAIFLINIICITIISNDVTYKTWAHLVAVYRFGKLK